MKKFREYLTSRFIAILSLMIISCGENKEDDSFEKKFEAVYGYTSCDIQIGTGLAVQNSTPWFIQYQTFKQGRFEFVYSAFSDSLCDNDGHLFVLNRDGNYEILSKDENTGLVSLKLTTTRFLTSKGSSAADYGEWINDSNLETYSCDAIMRDYCKPIFDIPKYITVKLTDEGLYPSSSVWDAGETLETISTDLATYPLKILNTPD